MTLYNFELDKTVTLREVAEALEKVDKRSGHGEHEIDLGEAGWHTIECDESFEVNTEEFLRALT